jgi:hypothetical protein
MILIGISIAYAAKKSNLGGKPPGKTCLRPAARPGIMKEIPGALIK